MPTTMGLPHFDEFLLNLQTNNLSDETVYNYERDLSVLENFLNETKIRKDITNHNILK